MPDLFRFDCVFYYTTDLDRAVEFYTDVVGLKLESRDIVARFLVNGVCFELVPTADKFAVSGKGNARLVLAVDDINAAIAYLQKRKVKVTGKRRVTTGWLASFYDPDSNELVVWQYA